MARGTPCQSRFCLSRPIAGPASPFELVFVRGGRGRLCGRHSPFCHELHKAAHRFSVRGKAKEAVKPRSLRLCVGLGGVKLLGPFLDDGFFCPARNGRRCTFRRGLFCVPPFSFRGYRLL